MTDMVRAGTLDLSALEHVRFPLDRINEALDGSHFRDGGFTNLVIEPHAADAGGS